MNIHGVLEHHLDNKASGAPCELDRQTKLLCPIAINFSLITQHQPIKLFHCLLKTSIIRSHNNLSKKKYFYEDKIIQQILSSINRRHIYDLNVMVALAMAAKSQDMVPLTGLILIIS